MALNKRLFFDENLPLGTLAKTLYNKVQTKEQLIELCFYFILMHELVVHKDFKKYSLIYYQKLFKEITGLDYNEIKIKL